MERLADFPIRLCVTVTTVKFSFVYILHERAYIIRFIGCVTHSRSHARGVDRVFDWRELPLLRYTSRRLLRRFHEDVRYVKSYRRKQIIRRWGSRLLSCMYIYIYKCSTQLYRVFDSGSRINGVEYGSFWLTGKRCKIEGWATGFIHFPRQVWNWFRDTCRCWYFPCNENNWGKICIEIWLLKYNWSNVFERVVWNICTHIQFVFCFLLFTYRIKITRFTIN